MIPLGDLSWQWGSSLGLPQTVGGDRMWQELCRGQSGGTVCGSDFCRGRSGPGRPFLRGTSYGMTALLPTRSHGTIYYLSMYYVCTKYQAIWGWGFGETWESLTPHCCTAKMRMRVIPVTLVKLSLKKRGQGKKSKRGLLFVPGLSPTPTLKALSNWCTNLSKKFNYFKLTNKLKFFSLIPDNVIQRSTNFKKNKRYSSLYIVAR